MGKQERYLLFRRARAENVGHFDSLDDLRKMAQASRARRAQPREGLVHRRAHRRGRRGRQLGRRRHRRRLDPVAADVGVERGDHLVGVAVHLAEDVLDVHLLDRLEQVRDAVVALHVVVARLAEVVVARAVARRRNVRRADARERGRERRDSRLGPVAHADLERGEGRGVGGRERGT